MPDDEINHGKIAFRFIILLGVVSLLADMTYESARSITGPYLAILGASGAVVGFTAGAGELFGYGLRFFSGLLIDIGPLQSPATLLIFWLFHYWLWQTGGK
jgi:hypothetical protein